MAYNVGFAQVSITPVFPGMQETIDRKVTDVMPPAGREAGASLGDAIGTGVASEVGAPSGSFARAITGAGDRAGGWLADRGLPAAGGFVSNVASGLVKGTSFVVDKVKGWGSSFATNLKAAGDAAGSGFLGSLVRGAGPLAVVFGVGAVVKGGWDRLVALEDAESVFKALQYNAEETERFVTAANNAVDGTPYALDTAVQASVAFVAAGIKEGAKLEAALGTMFDVAAAFNIPPEEAVQIWTTIAANGKVSLNEIKRLQQRGVPALQMVADHYGITTEAASQMVTDGKVSFEEFSDAMHENVDGAALAAGDTTRGALGNLKTAISRFAAEVLKILGFDQFKDVFLGLTDGLKKITAAVTWLSPFLGPLGQGLAIVAGSFYGLAIAVKLSTGAFKVLARNVANHPVILVLALITAAVIYLWKNNETFREGVISVWNAVKNVVGKVWTGTLKPIFESIKGWVLDTLLPAMKSFWENGVKPAWSAISGAIKNAWTNYIQPVFRAIGDFIQNVLAPIFKWLYENVVLTYFKAIQLYIKVAWTVIKVVFNAIVWTIQNVLAPIFKFLYENVIKPVWNFIAAAIKVAWTVIKAIFESIKWTIDNVLAPIFRFLYENVIKPVWNFIAAAITVAWTVIKAIFTAIKWTIDNVLAPIFRFLYDKVIKPIWNKISFAIQVAWNVIKFVFDLIKWTIVNVLIPIFKSFYEKTVKPIWDKISLSIKVTWAAIKIIWDRIKWYIQNVLTPPFQNFWNKVIKPVWNGIKNTISAVWNNGIKPILNTFKNFITDVVAPGFRNGVNRIKDLWNGVKAVVAAPINFVIGTVYNDGIKKVFDNVASAIGSSTRLPRGRLVSTGGSGYGTSGGGFSGAGRARGGPTQPGWTMVGEEGPELVNFDDRSRVYTAVQTAAALRASRRMQDPGTDEAPDGGVWDGLSRGWNGAKRAVGNALSNIKEWVQGGLAEAARAVLNPVKRSITNMMPNNMYGKIVGGAAKKPIDSLIKWIKGKDNEFGGGGGTFGGKATGGTIRGAQPHVNRAANQIRNAVGEPRMFAQAFNRSMVGDHKTGLAVDFMAKNLQKTANFIASNGRALGVRYMAYNAKLWHPGRGWSPLGRGYGNDPMHRWHVHASFNPRRSVKGVSRMDGGGLLYPGEYAHHTRKMKQPDAVLTDGQWRDISRLATSNVSTGTSYGDIIVTVNPKDLDGLRSIEDFANMLRRKTRQNGGRP